MSQQSFVTDLWALARDGRQMEGEVPVSGLERLADSVLEPTGTVRFVLDGSRDDEGRSIVALRIQGGLVLECQRCLGPLAWPVALDARLALLRPGAALPEDELENDEFDSFEAEPLTDVLALVEDELLLALPLVPRHEDCEPPVKSVGSEETSPFAVLKQLRGTGKT